MNWYIGQPIVAVKHSIAGHFRKGQEFTIKSLRGSWCNCGRIQLDVGLVPTGNIAKCVKCGTTTENGGVLWKSEICFAPLDQDISELTEILEQSNSIQNV